MVRESDDISKWQGLYSCTAVLRDDHQKGGPASTGILVCGMNVSGTSLIRHLSFDKPLKGKDPFAFILYINL